MKKGLWGVALAAMMACGLGGAQRAEAELIQVGGGGINSDNAAINFEGVIDLYRGSFKGVVSYVSDFAPLPGENVYSFTSYFSAGSPTRAELMLGDNYINFDGFTLILRYFNLDSYLPDSAFLPDFGDAPVGVVSYVPLPTSAPLFGTALLVLAGIGYASQRSKATAVKLPAV